MSSALSSQRQLNNPQYPFLFWRVYGEHVDRKSRNFAFCGMGSILFFIVLMSFFTPQKTISLPVGQRKIQLVMRTYTSPVTKKVKKENFEKIVTEDSDFTIPKEVKPVEKIVEPPKVKPEPKVIKKDPPKPIKKKIQKTPPKVQKAPQQVKEVEGVTAQSQVAVPKAVGNTKPDNARKSQVLAMLLQEIEKRKSYPRQARRSGAEGTCELLVQVDNNGKVIATSLNKSSGKVVLDNACKRLGKELIGLSVGKTAGMKIIIPVHYTLDD